MRRNAPFGAAPPPRGPARGRPGRDGEEAGWFIKGYNSGLQLGGLLHAHQAASTEKRKMTAMSAKTAATAQGLSVQKRHHVQT